MSRLNICGPALIKLRRERGWTQEITAARLQCKGVNMSRQMLANLESGRSQVTDRHLVAFQKVFGARIIRLFPLAIQVLDDSLVQGENTQPVKRPPRAGNKR